MQTFMIEAEHGLKMFRMNAPLVAAGVVNIESFNRTSEVSIAQAMRSPDGAAKKEHPVSTAIHRSRPSPAGFGTFWKIDAVAETLHFFGGHRRGLTAKGDDVVIGHGRAFSMTDRTAAVFHKCIHTL